MYKLGLRLVVDSVIDKPPRYLKFWRKVPKFPESRNLLSQDELHALPV